MLTHLIESWSSLYANHAALRTAIEFTHIGGLVVGGGCAIAADVDTYLCSRTFWLKIALMMWLLVNGALLLRRERLVKGGEPRAWAHLHHTATASLVSWCLTTLAGAALPNIG